MATKTIKLEKPIEMHGKTFTELALKEPSGSQLLEFGEPLILSQTRDGASFYVEDKEAIRSYLDKCVVHENGADILQFATISDIRKFKETLFGFFGGAAAT